MKSTFLPMQRTTFKIALIFAIFCMAITVRAQKVKQNTIVIKYQGPPLCPLEKTWSIPYEYEITCNGKNCEPGPNRANPRAFSKDLQIMSIFYSPRELRKCDTCYRMTIDLGECILENKITLAPNQKPSTAIPTFSYECTFNYPFSLVLKNPHDSIIYSVKWDAGTPVKMLFPEAMTDKIAGYNGFASPAQLEAGWLAHRDQFYQAASEGLVRNWIKEAEKTLDLHHREKAATMNLTFFYMKDKKVQRPGLDSLMDLTKAIDDSVQMHFKRKDNKNWHSKPLQEILVQAQKIIDRESNSFIAQVKEGKIEKDLGDEMIMGLFANRLTLMLLQNRYDEGLAELDNVLKNKNMPKGMPVHYLETLRGYYEVEKVRYAKNKNRYGW